MKTPLQEVWEEIYQTSSPAPVPRPWVVAERVNAALDAAPSERKYTMRKKYRAALFLAAALALLTGTAFAVAQNWTVLDAFFGGDSPVGETLMDDSQYAVSDENYTMTVSSSVAAEDIVYLILTVEAKTPQAAETLLAEEFINIDTFSVMTSEEGSTVSSVGYGEEKALGTEMSRTFSMKINLVGQLPESLSIRLGGMEEWLTVPVSPADHSITLSIGKTGDGAGTFFHAAGGEVTLDTVTLTPLGLTLAYSFPEGEESRPVLAFLRKDGTLESWSQMVGDGTERLRIQETGVTGSYAFHSVEDLSQLEAVVFEEMAYPLDGGTPYAVDLSRIPQPFSLPLEDRLVEGGAFTVPVRALSEKLGATCRWDAESRSAAISFRGSTIVLTEGSTTALVNGKPVELPAAPRVRNGVLAADPMVFSDAFSLSMCAAFADGYATDREEDGAWVVLP